MSIRATTPRGRGSSVVLVVDDHSINRRIILDMLTHRSDGYPIFWPLSAYRFPTPISYWEPAFHGVAFSLICDGAIVAASFRLAADRLRRPVGD